MGKKVGKLIKEARLAADLTQEQLARRVSGIDAKDVSLAERGEKDLTQTQLKKIATVTGVTQKSLLDAAKSESPSAKSTKSTTTKSAATKAKTPSNANSTMKVTATERKLVEAYRLASTDVRKRALSLLQGKEESALEALLGGDVGDKVSDMLEDVIGGLLGGK